MAIETPEDVIHELGVLFDAVNPDYLRNRADDDKAIHGAAALVQHKDAERIAVALENIAESLSNIVRNGIHTETGF